MDFPLKTFGFAMLVLLLAGELAIENFVILAIGGYLIVKHIGIYSGAPVYT